MFTKENTLYADTYKYLQHKTKKIIALSISLNTFTEDDFTEVDMTTPITPIVENKTIFWNDRKFIVKPKNFTYAGIKTSIIKLRYSDDDQMALILNRENNAEDEAAYNEMQRWREFAAEIAKKCLNI